MRELKNEIIKSAMRQSENDGQESDIKDESLISSLKVLLVNDEFFILCMLKQIVEQVGISDIDQA